MVHVGYDYHDRLPEPLTKKALKLLDEIFITSLWASETIRPAWFKSLDEQLGDSNEKK